MGGKEQKMLGGAASCIIRVEGCVGRGVGVFSRRAAGQAAR